ncbi:glycosyltransferase [Aeoliella mucimassa]|uniref:Teichuronic acid biosynthesis glycosyltransferase TuaC n=1 Tax=Aeoliella mucimassa TaxID=2527972 RepID=A0A518AKY4_9BACT|nr:glycosyltransferase [Aeoliella mucimassa]QDU55344.1 Putative teichuronic acid biosynthesis glycosyltransferase TuaC [Aeoliella mucimassa]
MKVLWPHNFSRKVQSSGVFMFILAEAMREVGVDVHLHYTGSLRQAWRLPFVAQQIREMSSDFDLVHAQFGSACALVSSAAKCSRLVSLRGTDLLGSDTGSLFNRLHGRVVRQMTHRALPSYEMVIVMSERMRTELSDYHGRCENVHVVPDGINLTRFQPLSRLEARERLGLGHDAKPWVLFASMKACNPLKRPELAQAAFDIAAEQRPEIVLKTLSGKTHDEVALWMAATDVLLLTSTREGWPNVVKEALACNTPFVATDVSDLALIARQEPSCTVTTADPAELAEGILRALDGPVPTTLRRHVEPMSTGTIASQLHGLYQELLNPQAIASHSHAA